MPESGVVVDFYAMMERAEFDPTKADWSIISERPPPEPATP